MDRTGASVPSGTTEVDRGHEEGLRAHTWDMVAAIAGLLFIALFIAMLFTPDTPSTDDSAEAISAAIADDRSGHQWALLLGFLSDVAFFFFLAGLWSRLRRAEGRAGMFSGLFAIAGAAFAATVLASAGFYLALVQGTTDLAADSEVFSTLVVLNDWAGVGVIPAAVALLLAAAGAITSTDTLPHWLGWIAALAALLLLLSLGGVFEEDLEEGAVAIAGFAGFVLMLVWILATSVVLLMRAGRPGRKGHEATA
ncbi:DUF4386 family protein [Trujillonella endophytica]|uniref:DUF4386 family protein n=1 Tax=Trujillonella endophytica TaxID=673521 RepID=A0A1H8WEA0_9ACTN|nr:DUF4386 family protein [Trujillella endophytica]SEP25961.1 protein of unknown function [Trujillella endophytica]